MQRMMRWYKLRSLRNCWPLIGITLILSLVLLFGWARASSTGHPAITGTGLNLGYQTDQVTADRRAIKCIAEAIRRYPAASRYTVRSSDSILCYIALDDEYERRALIYDRVHHELININSGASISWKGVTGPMVMEIARGKGSYMDFERFGCESWP